MDSRLVFVTLHFLQRVYHEGLSPDNPISSIYNELIELLKSQRLRLLEVHNGWIDCQLSSFSDDMDDLLMWDFLDDCDPLSSERLSLSDKTIDSELLENSLLAGCFLVEDDDRANKVLSYGIPAFSYSSTVELLNRHEKRQTPVVIKKDEPFEWKEKLNKLFQEKPALPVNSIVIIDPYLPSGWYNNLPSIIEFLTPKQLDIPIHVTLVYSKDIDNPKNSDYVESFEQGKQIGSKYFKSVYEGLRRITSQRDIALELIRCENENEKIFHDRIILTNSFRIKSGAGFSLLYSGVFEKLAQNSTELTVDYMYFRSNLYESPLVDTLKVSDSNNRIFGMLDLFD